MSKDLVGLSVAELDALIAEAQSVRSGTRERRRLELKSEIESRLKAEGFTAYEVLGAKVKGKPQAMPPRYADRHDKSLTWSGKGRTPAWLQAKLDAGQRLDDFLISWRRMRATSSRAARSYSLNVM